VERGHRAWPRRCPSQKGNSTTTSGTGRMTPNGGKLEGAWGRRPSRWVTATTFKRLERETGRPHISGKTPAEELAETRNTSRPTSSLMWHLFARKRAKNRLTGKRETTSASLGGYRDSKYDRRTVSTADNGQSQEGRRRGTRKGALPNSGKKKRKIRAAMQTKRKSYRQEKIKLIPKQKGGKRRESWKEKVRRERGSSLENAKRITGRGEKLPGAEHGHHRLKKTLAIAVETNKRTEEEFPQEENNDAPT